jgi:hypothetical protein
MFRNPTISTSNGSSLSEGLKKTHTTNYHIVSAPNPTVDFTHDKENDSEGSDYEKTSLNEQQSENNGSNESDDNVEPPPIVEPPPDKILRGKKFQQTSPLLSTNSTSSSSSPSTITATTETSTNIAIHSTSTSSPLLSPPPSHPSSSIETNISQQPPNTNENVTTTPPLPQTDAPNDASLKGNEKESTKNFSSFLDGLESFDLAELEIEVDPSLLVDDVDAIEDILAFPLSSEQK